MEFHGNIDLQDNEIQQMAFGADIDFPVTPVIGRMVFKNSKLYMCVDLNGILPIWLPITNTVNSYTHTQSVAATTWTITHNLQTLNPTVQLYNSFDSQLIPDAINVIDNNTISIVLSASITGKVVIVMGDEMPNDGIGILEPTIFAVTKQFDLQTTMVIRHNLGYYPIVRVFVGNEEIYPFNIIQDDIFQVTVTFTNPTSATIRLV